MLRGLKDPSKRGQLHLPPPNRDAPLAFKCLAQSGCWVSWGTWLILFYFSIFFCFLQLLCNKAAFEENVPLCLPISICVGNLLPGPNRFCVHSFFGQPTRVTPGENAHSPADSTHHGCVQSLVTQELEGVDDAEDFAVVCAALKDVGVTADMLVCGGAGRSRCVCSYLLPLFALPSRT